MTRPEDMNRARRYWRNVRLFLGRPDTLGFMGAQVFSALALGTTDGIGTSAVIARLLAQQPLDHGIGIAGLSQQASQHQEAIDLENEHFEKEMEIEYHQHLQEVTTLLREHQKEADRDIWEQRTEQYQTLMTVAALLFAGGFALVVEGQLPDGIADCARSSATAGCSGWASPRCSSRSSSRWRCRSACQASWWCARRGSSARSKTCARSCRSTRTRPAAVASVRTSCDGG